MIPVNYSKQQINFRTTFLKYMKNRVSLSLGFNTRIKIIADYTTSPSEPLGIGVGLGPHLFSLSLAYASESSHLPLCLWHQTSIKTQRILFLDVITYPDPWHPSFLAHSLRLKWEIVTWLLSVARMVALLWWSWQPEPVMEGGSQATRNGIVILRSHSSEVQLSFHL